MRVEIRESAFDPWIEVSEFRRTQIAFGKAGASAVFVGTMRDFNEGDDVTSMVLEHYPGMTERQLEDMTREAIAAHQLEDALVIHRVGNIVPGDDIVLVAAFSAHRKAAFDACRAMMETLKSTAPFWKKETLTSGDRWVEKNTAG
ncbi:MAG: molybdenum cofactor biosynthesis protein MoaE [Arenicellales bacterium]